jgi:hypothetical protein
MQIDEEALAAIVREIVERLLAKNPALIVSSPSGDAGADSVHEHYGRVLSEGDLLACRKAQKRAIRVEPRTIITPLARDRAKDMGIRILERTGR